MTIKTHGGAAPRESLNQRLGWLRPAWCKSTTPVARHPELNNDLSTTYQLVANVHGHRHCYNA